MSARCSVVIPSYNRAALVDRLLDALTRQSVPADQFEVIIVLDGSTDGSAALLARWEASGRLPHLRWLRQEQQGQAAARTAGSQLASTPVLLFLDDDIIPARGLVEAHLRRHASGEALAVFGAARVLRDGSGGLYQTILWAWWEDAYYTRALPGRQPGYRDFCAGNVSLRREDFFRVGGFDPEFRKYGGEDYDLGYRLLKAGVRFVTEPAAEAKHHHLSTPQRILRNVRQEGMNDVYLGRKHPELRRGLRLMCRTHGAWAVFRHPAQVDLTMRILQWPLRIYEKLLLRAAWRNLFGKLRHHAYWMGVRDALRTWEAYQAYCQVAPPVPSLALDVTRGLPEILPRIWVEGPVEIAVTGASHEQGILHVREPILGPIHTELAERLLQRMTPQLLAVMAAHEPATPRTAQG